MTIEFRTRDFSYIKQWPNWTGVIPVIGDTIILHFGDYNEKAETYRVEDRHISGTEPDKIIICIDNLEKR